MIHAGQLYRAFVRDQISGLPKENRDDIKRVLSLFVDFEIGQHLVERDLIALGRLEDFVITEQELSEPVLESLLMIARFFKKFEELECDRDIALKAFHGRQQTLGHPNYSENTLVFARYYAGLLLGHSLPSFVPQFKHGPGSVCEGNFGLDKSNLPLSERLASSTMCKILDPIKRIRTEPMMEETRITVVPKDWRGGRVIGMEPAWNMVLQLGLKDWLEHRSFAYVPYYNQARQYGRLRETREFRLATVDLSSASDYITVDLVADVFPDAWFSAMAEVRTPRYRLPDDTVHRTESFALMGNGFCFPTLSIISLVFAVTAATIALGRKPSRHMWDYCTQTLGIQTFGDDLVFPVCMFDTLAYVYAQAGLVINNQKTGLGRFRETCGRYQFGDRNPFRCYYVHHLTWTPESYGGLLSLQNDLYNGGYRRSALAIACSAPSWVPRSNPSSSRPFGSGLIVEGLDPDGKWCRSRQRLRYPSFTELVRMRDVNLADQSGWFSAFHGGIPKEEVSVRTGTLRAIRS